MAQRRAVPGTQQVMGGERVGANLARGWETRRALRPDQPACRGQRAGTQRQSSGQPGAHAENRVEHGGRPAPRAFRPVAAFGVSSSSTTTSSSLVSRQRIARRDLCAGRGRTARREPVAHAGSGPGLGESPGGPAAARRAEAARARAPVSGCKPITRAGQRADAFGQIGEKSPPTTGPVGPVRVIHATGPGRGAGWSRMARLRMRPWIKANGTRGTLLVTRPSSSSAARGGGAARPASCARCAASAVSHSGSSSWMAQPRQVLESSVAGAPEHGQGPAATEMSCVLP